jgi:hypothetical protein
MSLMPLSVPLITQLLNGYVTLSWQKRRLSLTKVRDLHWINDLGDFSYRQRPKELMCLPQRSRLKVSTPKHELLYTDDQGAMIIDPDTSPTTGMTQ